MVCRQISIFQFQYGAIKRQAAKTEVERLKPYFNSNMVRLKEADNYKEAKEMLYFNSNMVRLKASTTFSIFCVHRISIPIWCD